MASSTALDRLVAPWAIAWAFGPYVLIDFGIRTEHVWIYGLLVPLCTLLLVGRKQMPRSAGIAFAGVVMTLAALWTLLPTIFGEATYESVPKAISHGEKYLRPIATMLVVGCFAQDLDATALRDTLRRTLLTLVWLLFANSLIVLLQLVLDLRPILFYFTAGIANADQASVSELALSMGRFCGIFNQPAESGMAYTFGLFAWAYVYATDVTWAKRPIFYIILGANLFGGFFAISKVFLLGGIPLFLVYVTVAKRLAFFFNWRIFALFLLFGTAVWLVVTSSDEFYQLAALTNSEEITKDPVNVFTAGRFGQEDTIVKVWFRHVWEISPIWGLGFAANTTPDNGYLEFFCQGGLVGLALYGLLIAAFAWVGLRRLHDEVGRMLLFVVVFIIGASTGAPVVTANRVSPIFWTLLTLIYLVLDAEKQPKGAIVEGEAAPAEARETAPAQ